jgi:hypothetical protein
MRRQRAELHAPCGGDDGGNRKRLERIDHERQEAQRARRAERHVDARPSRWETAPWISCELGIRPGKRRVGLPGNLPEKTVLSWRPVDGREPRIVRIKRVVAVRQDLEQATDGGQAVTRARGVDRAREVPEYVRDRLREVLLGHGLAQPADDGMIGHRKARAARKRAPVRIDQNGGGHAL